MKRAVVFACSLAAGFAMASALAETYKADSLLNRAAAAMGADQLNSLRYSASGSGGGTGQPYTAGKPWPRQNVTLTRSINYQTASQQDEVTRSRAEERGGTGVPLTGEQKLTELVSAAYAWNIAGGNTAPGARYVDERVPQIWLSPHGVIKAAQKNNATLEWRTNGGKPIAAVSFAENGRYRATALINDSYLVERIEAVVPNPVLGDMPVVTTFSEYRDFGKIKFPTRIEETQGGFTTAQFVVTDVQPNAKVDIQVPDAVRNAKENVATQKLADGVWLLAGGSHNSLAIEMKDHAVVIEGPLGDFRAVPVIAEVKQLIPRKPIRYVVNTHVHFDHSGGLGAFVAEGATVVTHANNRPYFTRAFTAKRSVKPDQLASSKRRPEFKTFDGKLVLGDGARNVELYHVRGNIHNDSLIMAYLPNEKILVQADLFAPLPANAQPPAKPSPVTLNFAENIERLKLPVERIVGIHGGVAPAAELKRALGR